MSNTRLILTLLTIYVCVSDAIKIRESEGARPIPTPAQLKYGGTMNALIHFNMGTYADCSSSDFWNLDQGYGPPSKPSTFEPVKLNVSNWIESMKHVGINSAVLTAKQGCGYLLWETNTKLPDGNKWVYGVDHKYPVVDLFVRECEKQGIGYGFYYSLSTSLYLNVAGFIVQDPSTLVPNQVNVTQEYYNQVTLDQLKELWNRHGNLTEIWLDGGVGTLREQVKQLILETPARTAVAFNGYGVSPNPSRWCGTENGHPKGTPEVWSTSCCDWCPYGSGSGCRPDSSEAVWNPSGVDVTLQVGDTWFYRNGTDLHSLEDLIGFYHNSVGSNGHLELDYAIDTDGVVHPSHYVRYKEFGDWIRSCYGSAVGGALLEFGMESVNFTFDSVTQIDRVSLEEDQSRGQLVISYAVQVQLAASEEWSLFSEGITIGSKRIDIPGPLFWVKGVRLVIQEAFDMPQVRIYAFAPDGCRA